MSSPSATGSGGFRDVGSLVFIFETYFSPHTIINHNITPETAREEIILIVPAIQQAATALTVWDNKCTTAQIVYSIRVLEAFLRKCSHLMRRARAVRQSTESERPHPEIVVMERGFAELRAALIQACHRAVQLERSARSAGNGAVDSREKVRQLNRLLGLANGMTFRYIEGLWAAPYMG